MADSFPVVTVPDNAADSTEAVGTKPKFWFRHPDMGPCLYKQARPGTGEDWAERIAAELARCIGLPNARYELAVWNGIRGVVSPSFVPATGHLILGNQLLLSLVPGYPPAKPGSRNFYRVSQHTVDRVLKVVAAQGLLPPVDWVAQASVCSPADVFVGYLLLDAWIGNQDRHHENWGCVIVPPTNPDPGAAVHLAPTFDHASSLGRNISDEERTNRLKTRDSGYGVAAFVEKARSALYAEEGDKKPLTTLRAFMLVADRCPAAARAWLSKLADVPPNTTLGLLRRIPRELVSDVGIEFAHRMLELNQGRLLELGAGLR